MSEDAATYNFEETLLAPNYPPGFEPDERTRGRRLLAECPEFRLWEMDQPGGEQVLESSDAIDNALKKYSYGLNDATNPSERIALATALESLANVSRAFPTQPMPLSVFYSPEYHFDYPGNAATCSKLAATLGMEILEVLRSNDPDQRAEECVGKFRNAINHLIRHESGKAGQRPEYLLILHAQGHFRITRERPTKTYLMERLERLGITYSGRNQKSRWREKFSNSGLADLPA